MGFKAGWGGGLASAPLNLSSPVISVSVGVWTTLSCNPGTWSGSPAPTFTYQWKRAGPSVYRCTAVIAGVPTWKVEARLDP